MKEPVVVDSTCLIGLERIAYLDVVPALFEPIIIPPKVEQEFGTSLTWLKVEAPSSPALVASLKLSVDDREAEAIALAYEKGWRIVLDDRQARSVARHLNLNIIGTVGVLVRAKQSGVIHLLKPLVEALERNSFYISDALKEEALRLVKE